jgi:hypothetical protein
MIPLWERISRMMDMACAKGRSTMVMSDCMSKWPRLGTRYEPARQQYGHASGQGTQSPHSSEETTLSDADVEVVCDSVEQASFRGSHLR